MKKTILSVCLSALVILGFTAMKGVAPATISGKITPVDGASEVWAIKEADSLKASISSEGTFQVEVKPGTWKLVVNAKAPYKSTEVNELVVTADNNTDAGEIKLEK